MNQRRANFALVIIASFFAGLVMLAWALKGIQIRYFDEAPIIMNVDTAHYPLYLGQASLQLPLLALALMFFFLATELFGQWTGTFLSFAGATSILLIWGTLFGIGFIPGVENSEGLKTLNQALFDFSLRHLVSLTGTVFLGFSFISLFNAALRKLTQGGFAIVRHFFTAILGGAGLIAIYSFLQAFPHKSTGEMLALFMTQYAQWLVLCFFFTPIYYFFYIPLRLLVGKEHYLYVRSKYARKPRVKKVKVKEKKEETIKEPSTPFRRKVSEPLPPPPESSSSISENSEPKPEPNGNPLS